MLKYIPGIYFIIVTYYQQYQTIDLLQLISFSSQVYSPNHLIFACVNVLKYDQSMRSLIFRYVSFSTNVVSLKSSVWDNFVIIVPLNVTYVIFLININVYMFLVPISWANKLIYKLIHIYI